MEKRITGLGVLAGAAAGIVSFGYARFVISPLVDRAIAFEEDRSHVEQALTGGHGHDTEVFTRAVQENIGTAAGSVVFGIVVGALFAVAFCVVTAVLRRRRIDADPRIGAALLACAGFLATALVPFLAYPANPPGVGHDDTVAARTTAHLAVLVASVVLACAATTVALRLAPRIGGWRSGVVSLGGYLVVVTVMLSLVPEFAETPEELIGPDGAVLFGGFPADLLADFRVAAIVNQGLLWLVIGAVFTCLLPRALRGATHHQELLRAHR
jgi:predicted cobalt transporter CbtA